MRILFFILMVFIAIGTECNSQQNRNEQIHFSIEIINLYFGRVEHVTILKNDSIKSEINKTSGHEKKFSRELTQNELKRIKKFLKDFPLKDLNEQYVDANVEDGTQINFEITINDLHKSIYISNKYQEDLGRLVEHVVSLLPEDYIGYSCDTTSS